MNSSKHSKQILKCLDKNYSTTRLCYKLLDDSYLDSRGRVREDVKFRINIPELDIRDSKIPKQGEEKFDTYLFLPEVEGRQGEGGLRTRGYFKFSYEIENGRWYACSFRGKRLFEVEPPKELDIDIDMLRAENRIARLPLVSVITVVFNGDKYIEETIQSIIKQSYPNIEYIVIDGCSTDNTLEIIKRYEDKIDYWISERDSGMYHALTKGFSLSNGNILSWLNSDDIYYPYTIETVVSTMLYYKIKWVTGVPSLIDEKGRMINVEHPKYYFRSLIKRGYYRGDILGYIQQESTFFTRGLLYKVGGINILLKLAADYDLWIKFAHYENLYTVKVILASFRKHQDQKSSNRAQYLKECSYVSPSPKLKLAKYILKPLGILLSRKILRSPYLKRFLR